MKGEWDDASEVIKWNLGNSRWITMTREVFHNGDILESELSSQVTSNPVDNSEFVIKMLFPSLLELSTVQKI